MDLLKSFNEFRKLTEGISFKRLQEICNAERENKCITLPFEINSFLYYFDSNQSYIIRCQFTGIDFNLPTDDYILCLDSINGTKYLITQTEAEKYVFKNYQDIPEEYIKAEEESKKRLTKRPPLTINDWSQQILTNNQLTVSLDSTTTNAESI